MAVDGAAVIAGIGTAGGGIVAVDMPWGGKAGEDKAGTGRGGEGMAEEGRAEPVTAAVGITGVITAARARCAIERGRAAVNVWRVLAFLPQGCLQTHYNNSHASLSNHLLKVTIKV